MNKLISIMNDKNKVPLNEVNEGLDRENTERRETTSDCTSRKLIGLQNQESGRFNLLRTRSGSAALGETGRSTSRTGEL